MHVVRGRGDDMTADAEIIDALLERAVETGDQGLRVWRPHRKLAFGRREVREAGYQAAREAALEHGFPPFERRTGGRAVAHTGDTVSFALVEPIEDLRLGATSRYDDATEVLQRALWRLGVPVQRGEPEGAFCPGNHSLSYRGKIAGLAQYVTSGAALVGGIVIVRDHGEIGAVLEAVYDALGVSFDQETVGSIERAGGRADPDTVVRTIEDAFTGDRETIVEEV